ncbi:hypothetical protein HYW67_00790 [Candidatus Parcubacteria bacterium]|nr:hypothetical protein [Candidatus Parcubacteria bacterium]
MKKIIFSLAVIGLAAVPGFAAGQGASTPAPISTPLVACTYAGPPAGCSYVPGPDYNPTTGCGMVLSCNVAPTPTPTLTVSLDSSTPLAKTITTSPDQTSVAFAAIRIAGGSVSAAINGIKLASDFPGTSNTVNAIYNIRVYDGAQLIGSTFLGGLPEFNGAYYYTWLDLAEPVVVPAGGVKIFNIVANVRPQTSGEARLGIASLNFVLPGAYTTGLPVYGNSMNIQPTPPPVKILSPTAGEYVNRGGPYTVRWSTSGTLPSDASVLLYLVRNGVALGRISASAVGAGATSYAWDTSAYFLEGSGAAQKPEAGDYQIKAALQSGGIPITTALSEQFSLSDQIIRSVNVGVPNGGELWQGGSVQTIQWGSSNVYEVVIYLLKGSGISAIWTIADLATNPSQYRWTIPDDIPNGSDYRVRVTDPSSGIFDESDQPFTIASQSGGSSLIPDGSLIRARGDYKVWIVKGGYRRHITSARIFSFYGHLGFAQVMEVDPGVPTRYAESDLVRAVGDARVWQIDAAGKKHWLKMNHEQFLARGHSPNAIFDINSRERDFYRAAADITP